MSPTIKSRFVSIAQAALLLSAFLVLPAKAAITATWLIGDGSWYTASDWSSGVVPGRNSNPADTAIFNANSGEVSVFLTADPILLNTLSYEPGAGAFTLDLFTNGGIAFTLTGAGITNTSGVLQTIDNEGATLTFAQDATITGNVLIINTSGLYFQNNASAGSSQITNNSGQLFIQGAASLGSSIVTNNSLVQFQGSTAAATTSTIINNAGGRVDITPASTGISIGSLSGAGLVRLGSNTLTLGSLNQHDTISGIIVDAGGGQLIKVGTGILTLTGTNTYTGTTTISAGTLQLGSGGTTGSVAGNIINNAALAFDLSNTTTYAGNLSGAGSLTQAGTGTLILTGRNSGYTGATTISAGGTLQLGDGGTDGSISNSSSIVNNGALVFDFSNTSNYGNIISAGGSLTQAGAGTLILTGTNTYTGVTTISAGTLQIGNGGTVGSISNSSSIVNNSALVFSNTGSLTYGNTISGSGSLTQLGIGGTGILILTGTNTYTGGTTISTGGTLHIAGSVAGNILNNATLAFLGSATANGNNITNNSSLDVSGVTSNITIGNLSGAGTVALGTKLLNIGSLNEDATISGIISGSASASANQLTKLGTGTLVLEGINTYTGLTTVAAGTLLLGNNEAKLASKTNTTASLAGNVVVDAGATLGGYGTIGGNLINNGTISPVYSSVGTLNIGGTFTQNSTGDYVANVTNTGISDNLIVTGNVTLGGNISIGALEQGFVPDYEYTILQTDGTISGEFSNINLDDIFFQDFLTGQLIQTSNTIKLIVSLNDAAIELAARTPNQHAVANSIIATNGTLAVDDLISVLTTATQFQNAMDQISGATYANQSLALAHMGGLFSNQIGDRLSSFNNCVDDVRFYRDGYQSSYAENCKNNKTIWMTLQSGNDQLTPDDVSGLNSTYNTLMMGFELPILESTTVGAGVAYNDFKGYATGGVEIANYSGQLMQLGIYGKHEMGPWLFGASVDAGITSSMQTQRQIQNGAGNLVGTAADQSVNVFSQQLRAAYNLAKTTGYNVQPFVGFISQQVSMGDFNETGDTGFELSVDNSAYYSARSQLGFQVEAPDSLILQPFASISWEHEFADQEAHFDGSLTGLDNLGSANVPFYIVSTDIGRESALVNAGVTLLARKNWDVTLAYEGRFASNWQANAGSLQVNVALD